MAKDFGKLIRNAAVMKEADAIAEQALSQSETPVESEVTAKTPVQQPVEEKIESKPLQQDANPEQKGTVTQETVGEDSKQEEQQVQTSHRGRKPKQAIEAFPEFPSALFSADKNNTKTVQATLPMDIYFRLMKMKLDPSIHVRNLGDLASMAVYEFVEKYCPEK